MDLMTEHIMVYDNKFVCAWLPMYGLVKVDNMILKIEGYEGHISSDKEIITAKYISERAYMDGREVRKLTEKEEVGWVGLVEPPALSQLKP
jgi:hypothetical protein